jgi:hypothetical protein
MEPTVGIEPTTSGLQIRPGAFMTVSEWFMVALRAL